MPKWQTWHARRPSPNVYRQEDDAARVSALEAFLEKKGLLRHSTPSEIAVRPLESVTLSGGVNIGSVFVVLSVSLALPCRHAGGRGTQSLAFGIWRH